VSRLAGSPFSQSNFRGAIGIAVGASFWLRLSKAAGPGLLVSVGYMDPGNWATDIAAGSRYGYGLLWVVLLSSLAAIQAKEMAVRYSVTAIREPAITGHRKGLLHNPVGAPGPTVLRQG
jgi:manganese transport protein